MERDAYTAVLYPLQDEVLGLVRDLDTGFYLTGGTAASRGYLDHRLSDDLDLFTNDRPEFSLWVERVIQAFGSRRSYTLEVVQRDHRFVRLIVSSSDHPLRIEMVNDVPSHIGEIREHEVLGRLDSPENILAHKITAVVDREEPKDLADIWGFGSRLHLSISDALNAAQSKAAGIFPADLARRLCTATEDDWKAVRWIEAPELDRYLADLAELGNELIVSSN
jgi:hypothetical protein